MLDNHFGGVPTIQHAVELSRKDKIMETELCNMCMITDAQGRVLVQERLPKPSNPWSGLTFPGGHVEPGETVVASVIREVQEETGLIISNLQNCGYIQWYNPVKQSQYFVFLFKTGTFSGTRPSILPKCCGILRKTCILRHKKCPALGQGIFLAAAGH